MIQTAGLMLVFMKSGPVLRIIRNIEIGTVNGDKTVTLICFCTWVMIYA